MPPRPDEGFVVYGAGILQRRLQAFTLEIEGVRQAADIEYIHRMRVASRRLRAAFSIFSDIFPPKKGPAWQRQMRRVTQALGEARDTDVQIEAIRRCMDELTDPALKPGLRRLALRWGQKRHGLQEDVLAALDRLAESGMLAELEAWLLPQAGRTAETYLYTPYLYLTAFEKITGCLKELLSYEPFVDQPERIAELHAMRIAAKRLRYTSEIFAPLYSDGLKGTLQTLREVQEELGSLHDCDVWIQELPLFLERERALTQTYLGHVRTFRRLQPGLDHFMQSQTAARGRIYAAFRDHWHAVQERQTWPRLMEMIQQPFFRAAPQPPPPVSTPVSTPVSPQTSPPETPPAQPPDEPAGT